VKAFVNTITLIAAHIAWSHVAKGGGKAGMHLACMQWTRNGKSEDF
jgi:hypothetical protein